MTSEPLKIYAADPRHTPSWQTVMQQAVSDVDELLALVKLEREQLPQLDSNNAFRLRVPRPFIKRMRTGAADDPLLRQVLPLAIENATVSGFVPDPLQELQAGHGNGIVSKYRGRTLLVTTGACPVHCRYCFRRHFPYQEQTLRSSMTAALSELASLDHDEVILSGGDPLSLGNKHLGRLIDRLQELPRLKRLRIHTRFPIIVPQRIDEELLTILNRITVPLVIVLHSNHAREIDNDVATAVQLLRDAGSTVLNQAVLLAGVNDTADRQVDLAEALWRARILPYYLHQLDPVAGAAHFLISDEKALSITEQLRARLPGYLVPRLVREVAGADSKTPLSI